MRNITFVFDLYSGWNPIARLNNQEHTVVGAVLCKLDQCGHSHPENKRFKNVMDGTLFKLESFVLSEISFSRKIDDTNILELLSKGSSFDWFLKYPYSRIIGQTPRFCLKDISVCNVNKIIQYIKHTFILVQHGHPPAFQLRKQYPRHVDGNHRH